MNRFPTRSRLCGIGACVQLSLLLEGFRSVTLSLHPQPRILDNSFVSCRQNRHRTASQSEQQSARRLGQLQDNLSSFDLALSPDEVKIIDDTSHIDLGFPPHPCQQFLDPM